MAYSFFIGSDFVFGITLIGIGLAIDSPLSLSPGRVNVKDKNLLGDRDFPLTNAISFAMLKDIGPPVW